MVLHLGQGQQQRVIGVASEARVDAGSGAHIPDVHVGASITGLHLAASLVHCEKTLGVLASWLNARRMPLLTAAGRCELAGQVVVRGIQHRQDWFWRWVALHGWHLECLEDQWAALAEESWDLATCSAVAEEVLPDTGPELVVRVIRLTFQRGEGTPESSGAGAAGSGGGGGAESGRAQDVWLCLGEEAHKQWLGHLTGAWHAARAAAVGSARERTGTTDLQPGFLQSPGVGANRTELSPFIQRAASEGEDAFHDVYLAPEEGGGWGEEDTEEDTEVVVSVAPVKEVAAAAAEEDEEEGQEEAAQARGMLYLQVTVQCTASIEVTAPCAVARITDPVRVEQAGGDLQLLAVHVGGMCVTLETPPAELAAFIVTGAVREILVQRAPAASAEAGGAPCGVWRRPQWLLAVVPTGRAPPDDACAADERAENSAKADPSSENEQAVRLRFTKGRGGAPGATTRLPECTLDLQTVWKEADPGTPKGPGSRPLGGLRCSCAAAARRRAVNAAAVNAGTAEHRVAPAPAAMAALQAASVAAAHGAKGEGEGGGLCQLALSMCVRIRCAEVRARMRDAAGVPVGGAYVADLRYTLTARINGTALIEGRMQCLEISDTSAAGVLYPVALTTRDPGADAGKDADSAGGSPVVMFTVENFTPLDLSFGGFHSHISFRVTQARVTFLMRFLADLWLRSRWTPSNVQEPDPAAAAATAAAVAAAGQQQQSDADDDPSAGKGDADDDPNAGKGDADDDPSAGKGDADDDPSAGKGDAAAAAAAAIEREAQEREAASAAILALTPLTKVEVTVSALTLTMPRNSLQREEWTVEVDRLEVCNSFRKRVRYYPLQRFHCQLAGARLLARAGGGPAQEQMAMTDTFDATITVQTPFGPPRADPSPAALRARPELMPPPKFWMDFVFEKLRLELSDQHLQLICKVIRENFSERSVHWAGAALPPIKQGPLHSQEPPMGDFSAMLNTALGSTRGPSQDGAKGDVPQPKRDLLARMNQRYTFAVKELVLQTSLAVAMMDPAPTPLARLTAVDFMVDFATLQTHNLAWEAVVAAHSLLQLTPSRRQPEAAGAQLVNGPPLVTCERPPRAAAPACRGESAVPSPTGDVPEVDVATEQGGEAAAAEDDRAEADGLAGMRAGQERGAGWGDTAGTEPLFFMDMFKTRGVLGNNLNLLLDFLNPEVSAEWGLLQGILMWVANGTGAADQPPRAPPGSSIVVVTYGAQDAAAQPPPGGLVCKVALTPSCRFHFLAEDSWKDAGVAASSLERSDSGSWADPAGASGFMAKADALVTFASFGRNRLLKVDTTNLGVMHRPGGKAQEAQIKEVLAPCNVVFTWKWTMLDPPGTAPAPCFREAEGQDSGVPASQQHLWVTKRPTWLRLRLEEMWRSQRPTWLRLRLEEMWR
ncbi:hypothetical protein CYMTET_30065, partial [Cymbomonas tetramitiformis]